MDANRGAYGSGMAGQPFDPIAYVKKPSVILRFISWVFAIIVFACIAAEGQRPYLDGSIDCAYNRSNACGFGIFVGVIAFLGCMVFLALDAMFDNWSNVTHRKWGVMADVIFSGLWTFMYFVCFCFLTNKWVTTPNELKKMWNSTSSNEAAIAFSFFSIITWGFLTALAFMRFRQGSQSAFAPSFEPNPEPTPYPGGATSVGNDSYQQPPFDPTPQPDTKSALPPSQPQYQSPAY